MHLARPVAGQDHARRALRADGADLRDADGEVAQDFEQEGLEFLVGAVDLVDQQHGRLGVPALERLEQRPTDEELLAEDVARRG